MKKATLINLIRYHVEKNDPAFYQEAHLIVRAFDRAGDHEIAEHLAGILANRTIEEPELPTHRERTLLTELSSEVRDYFEKVPCEEALLDLPKVIHRDLTGIYNTITQDEGLHKFLFYGEPGTGKTEAAKQLARMLRIPLYMVSFPALIDCKLGQTQKNLLALFQALNKVAAQQEVLVLFDEIDALVMDRINEHDLREMGRVTSTFLKCMESLSPKIIMLATTNLYSSIDKALLRRFDFLLNFNRYSNEDRLRVAEFLLDYYQRKMKVGAKNLRLFRKILQLSPRLPNPGDLKNLIRTSIAFSDHKDDKDYLRRLYEGITGKYPDDPMKLQEEGFTLREIDVLLLSKSA